LLPSSAVDQAVADSPAVDDEAAVLGVEFAPQPGGVGVEGPGLRGAPVGPDGVQELFLAEDPVRVGGEDAQQSELFLRKVDLALADGDPAACGVDDQLADPARPAAGMGAAAQDGADPRPQLGIAKGLAFR
jgi:hypothetical protein